MDTNKKELNMKELEKVNGCGPITGFSKIGQLPPRKKNTDETESEQK